MTIPWELGRARRRIAWLTGPEVGLDLSGLRVYTEAATGPYRMTAGVALAAGAATAHAMARDTRFGAAQEAITQTREFVEALGIDQSRLTFSEGHDSGELARADLVTNMGMLRPLDARRIGQMRTGAVISLMYEPWEFRGGDVDLAAGERAGVWVVGANEHNGVVRCFRSAGVLAIQGLLGLGLGVFNSRVMVACANRFLGFILDGLCGAVRHVDVLDSPAVCGPLHRNASVVSARGVNRGHYDALVVFDLPQPGRWTVANSLEAVWPRECLGDFDACVQAMGDVRREDFPQAKFFPEAAPPRGYMGLNPASLGLDLVLEVVGAGLRAGQEACRFHARWGRRAVGEEWKGLSWALPMGRVEDSGLE